MGSAASAESREDRRAQQRPQRPATPPQEQRPNVLPLVVVEGRYHPYPGQSDPYVHWLTPTTTQRMRAELVVSEAETPFAISATGPTRADPIPYTPDGGYPPVRHSLLPISS